MPLYEWKCKKCEQVEVLVVKIDEYDIPPTTECKCEDEGDWERFLSQAPAFSGPRGKGNW